MRRQLPWVIGFALFVTSSAFSQDCESVIALSRGVDVLIADRDSIEQNASFFCEAYSSGVEINGSAKLGASYKFLSATLGASESSEQAVAAKYCSAGNGSSASRLAFRRYVESISPQAYIAYEQCLRMYQQELRFEVTPSSILANEFTLAAEFVSSTGQPSAQVTYSASSGVECAWNISDGKMCEIRNGSSAFLDCKRADSSKPSYVKVMRTNIGHGQERLTLPWQQYAPDGTPLASLSKLSARMLEIEKKVQGSNEDSRKSAAESGIISLKAVNTRSLLDGSACPTGRDSSRGNLQGRVEFLKSFASTPVVSISLSEFDVRSIDGRDSSRLHVGVLSVDPKGFNYSFSTWCTSIVNSASASWIAVGQ